MIKLKINTGYNEYEEIFDNRKEYNNYLEEQIKIKKEEIIEFLVNDCGVIRKEALKRVENEYKDCKENAQVLFGDSASMELIEYDITFDDFLDEIGIKYEYKGIINQFIFKKNDIEYKIERISGKWTSQLEPNEYVFKNGIIDKNVAEKIFTKEELKGRTLLLDL